MPKAIIGASENSFTRGQENIFKICGAGMNSGPDPKVELSATNHTWTNPATVIGKNAKWICIASTPTRKTAKKVPTSISTMDDLTITVTFDVALSTEYQVTITCDDIEYTDP